MYILVDFLDGAIFVEKKQIIIVLISEFQYVLTFAKIYYQMKKSNCKKLEII
jgi:hypothetical protein